MSRLILQDVKTACKVPRVTDYDEELLQLTNLALSFLAKIGGCQLGVVINPATSWEEILTDISILPNAIGYITGKVQLLFDPPASSAAVTAINEMIKEQEWTIQEIIEGRLR